MVESKLTVRRCVRAYVCMYQTCHTSGGTVSGGDSSIQVYYTYTHVQRGRVSVTTPTHWPTLSALNSW